MLDCNYCSESECSGFKAVWDDVLAASKLCELCWVLAYECFNFICPVLQLDIDIFFWVQWACWLSSPGVINEVTSFIRMIPGCSVTPHIFCRSLAYIMLLYISTVSYSEKYTSCIALNFCFISQLAVFMSLVSETVLMWCDWFGLNILNKVSSLAYIILFSFFDYSSVSMLCRVVIFTITSVQFNAFQWRTADWGLVLLLFWPVLYKQHQTWIILFLYK